MGELVAALRANDPDLFQRWQSVGGEGGCCRVYRGALKIPHLGDVVSDMNGDGVFTGREAHNTYQSNEHFSATLIHFCNSGIFDCRPTCNRSH